MQLVEFVLCAESTFLICGKAGNHYGLCLKAVCACLCPPVMSYELKPLQIKLPSKCLLQVFFL